jgi:hypothetical protein
MLDLDKDKTFISDKTYLKKEKIKKKCKKKINLIS